MEKKVNETEAQTLLGEAWETLTTKAPNSSFQVLEDALRGGATVFPSQSLDNFTVQKHVIVDGDLILKGVLEIESGGKLFVRGKLSAQDVVANGCLYVMGPLSVAGVFYGAQESYEAILCGEVQIQTLLLHYNYQYIERGKRYGSHSATRRLWDERDGAKALIAVLREMGYQGVVSSPSLAQFFRMRSKWTTPTKPSKKQLAAVKATTPPKKKASKKRKRAV